MGQNQLSAVLAKNKLGANGQLGSSLANRESPNKKPEISSIEPKFKTQKTSLEKARDV